ncbi:MAG: SUF system NifU family Fe-S cluster assembly protein [Legionellales bacterium]|nr:SUF system NifU family Fe-S cluster assembly protein [Legionellales bacterium]|tara:strand:- start:556 stop:1002 length:447 start_codon:yes stop_codon:yes gene_type:complete
MDDILDLYQEVILDHGRHPRCYGQIEPVQFTIQGHNPLCGDQIQIYLSKQNNRIVQLQFTGSGCAISKASASLLCMRLANLDVDEAMAILRDFQAMVKGECAGSDRLKKLAVMSGVQAFPSRVKCATLASHAISSILAGDQKTVTTET